MYKVVDEAAEIYLEKKKIFGGEMKTRRNIPTYVRRIIRKKLELSKKFLMSDPWLENYRIQEKIENVEKELSFHYKERREKLKMIQ